VSALEYGLGLRRISQYLQLWRNPAKPVPTPEPPAAEPEEQAPTPVSRGANQVSHIYASHHVAENELGGETTRLNWREDTSAKGWAPADDLLIGPEPAPVPAAEVGERTRVLNPHRTDRHADAVALELTRPATEPPVIYQRLVDELGGYPTWDRAGMAFGDGQTNTAWVTTGGTR
jgi:hypothetical protein